MIIKQLSIRKSNSSSHFDCLVIVVDEIILCEIRLLEKHFPAMLLHVGRRPT